MESIERRVLWRKGRVERGEGKREGREGVESDRQERASHRGRGEGELVYNHLRDPFVEEKRLHSSEGAAHNRGGYT